MHLGQDSRWYKPCSRDPKASLEVVTMSGNAHERSHDDEPRAATAAALLAENSAKSGTRPTTAPGEASRDTFTSPPKPVASGALGPTVIEWMSVETPPSSREDLPPMPSSTTATDPLAAVGCEVGTLVDRTYRVEKTLGVGGMGVVALATDERLDRKVAIKFIKPELFAFPEMRTFFHDEARAMARVSHRNVLSVFAFGEHGAVPFFVMEYVDGFTAETWLANRPAGALPNIDEAVQILDQACLGVEAIHGTNTVHRDLKPSNLLLEGQPGTPGFRVSVGDLGVARVWGGGGGGGDSFIVGSSLYMAPEAALGEDEIPELASLRDVYALGCIAYELFTGAPPFHGETDMNVLSQHVLDVPKPPSALRPDLPKGYDAIILKALAKEPRSRYATVGELRAALLAEHTGERLPERILVADDDDDWRALIVASLRSRFPNAVIDHVADGEAAMRAFEATPYSVVLADLEMPTMDGATLTMGLRAIDGASRTPIIVLTAAGGPKEWQRLSAIGADAFLVKPVNADDVELVIKRALRSRSHVSSDAA